MSLDSNPAFVYGLQAIKGVENEDLFVMQKRGNQRQCEILPPLWKQYGSRVEGVEICFHCDQAYGLCFHPCVSIVADYVHIAGNHVDHKGIRQINRIPFQKMQLAQRFLQSLLYVVVVPGFFSGILPVILAGVGLEIKIEFGVYRNAAVIFWLAGVAILLSCAWCFASEAESTPAYNESNRLITVGPYSFVRNPMYLAQLSIVLGYFLWTGELIVFVYLINYMFIVYFITTYYEEPYLFRKFGDAYADYTESVPKWIPRLTRYSARKK